MSHRKFRAPRHGSLGYLPRKRCKRGRPRIKAVRKDDSSQKPHLTSFLGYKAGMTHVLRDGQKVGQKVITVEVVEAVSVIECPPLNIIGIKGLRRTPFGTKTLTSVFTKEIPEGAKRRFSHDWTNPVGKLVFRHHEGLYDDEEYVKDRQSKLDLISNRADIVRLIAHTQPNLIGIQKKAHVIEVQINGGSIADKLKYAQTLLGTTVRVGDVFKNYEMIDIVGITKGKGTKGVISRWGVTRLPRKTHKGLRKVACIGAWHPSRVMYTVARVGQKGFHHRVEYNKKIYLVGHSLADSANESTGKFAGTTEHDLTKKSINPMGGFPGYGNVTEDFLVVHGSVPGPRRAPLALRSTLKPQKTVRALAKVPLKFIDTSSKMGRGRFQTLEEKRSFMGKTKKISEAERAEKLAAARETRASE